MNNCSNGFSYRRIMFRNIIKNSYIYYNMNRKKLGKKLGKVRQK